MHNTNIVVAQSNWDDGLPSQVQASGSWATPLLICSSTESTDLESRTTTRFIGSEDENKGEGENENFEKVCLLRIARTYFVDFWFTMVK